jgi:hypothetical protein
MPNERQIREVARKVLQAGKLPGRDPDGTWGGKGTGAPCAVCWERITPAQVEYEIQFHHDGATPRVDSYALHLRCFAAWEMERTKPTTTPEVPMTTASPSLPASEALQFSLTGTIATWDHFGRWLRIGERNFWVAPDVSQAGLVPGARVTVSGHQEDLTTRWIVTRGHLIGEGTPW